MRRVLILLLALLTLSACAAPVETVEETPPPQEAPAAPAEPAPADSLPNRAADDCSLTLEAPLADGRTLLLEAVGKRVDEYNFGVREVRVYDGEELIQTVLSREAIETEWGPDMPEEFYGYTECWSVKESMTVLDLNFDGSTDFGLFGWTANNTIPYYYWIWDPETEQYQYAFTLQGAEVHPETKELTSGYKDGPAGSQWITEVYKPDEDGALYLQRVERDTCDFEPEPPSYLDVQRGWAHEIWVPLEGREPISPRDDSWSLEADLSLTRREVPVYEDNGDGTVSHFTEIWEFWDGEPQLVERKEYTDENHP